MDLVMLLILVIILWAIFWWIPHQINETVRGTLSSFAREHNLDFKTNRRGLFDSDDEVTGTYRGRRFELRYFPAPHWFPNDAGLATDAVALDLWRQRPSHKRLWISNRGPISPRTGKELTSGDTRLDRRFSIRSRPKYLASRVLADESVREAILSTFSYFNQGTITAFPSGNITLRRNYPFRNKRVLQRTCDLMTRIAEEIEATDQETKQPAED
jgi:hypothetical protein